MKEGREKGASAAAARSFLGVAWNLLLLGSLLGTNILTLYSLTVYRELDRFLLRSTTDNMIDEKLLQELASLREQFQNAQQDLHDARGALQHGREAVPTPEAEALLLKSYSGIPQTIPELTAYSAVKRLPLGRNPANGEETIVSPVGHACFRSLELLEKYMDYTIGSLCPDDWDLAQKLMVKGCEPLPRRRCFSRTSSNYSSPLALPESMWSNPPDDTVLWTRYTCKSFACLNRRAKESNGFTDCAGCFDLEGAERERWMKTRDKLDFGVDQVLALKEGSIRIGLDLGGGSGTFAARLKQFNVTIITSTLNLNGPFNEFVALRGFLPLYITISQRLPFFDNTLDLVHSMHVLSYWIPTLSLEFLLYDIDRILRPGGIFWLDHFFATADQMEATFVHMIRNLGYVERRWVTGRKNDPNGMRNQEMYLSALLEKPIRDQAP